MSNDKEEELLMPLEGISIEFVTHVSPGKETTYQALSMETLVTLCLREIVNYQSGELWNDAYGLELLRRAIVQEEEEAWIEVQHCFNGLVRAWSRRHPKRDVACRLDSEENYVAQTFERFWQATALNAISRIDYCIIPINCAGD